MHLTTPGISYHFLSLSNVGVHVPVSTLHFGWGASCSREDPENKAQQPSCPFECPKPFHRIQSQVRSWSRGFFYGRFGLEPDHETQSPIHQTKPTQSGHDSLSMHVEEVRREMSFPFNNLTQRLILT